MTETLYRAADPHDLSPPVMLDGFTLLYHRPSGATHLLAEPAPQIIAALGDGPAAIGDLVGRLGRDHDLAADGDASAIVMARLTELVALGLVAIA